MNALSYAFSKSFSTVTKYSGVYVEEKKNNKDLHLLPLTKKKNMYSTDCMHHILESSYLSRKLTTFIRNKS